MLWKGDYMALTIKIDSFEGPFDVLLHLIEKDEMDIYNIKIHRITSEYISYIENMKQIDMEIAAEFIVMASMLLEIKSKMLLPDHQLGDFDLSNEDDPRYELITKLMEYKKFKQLGLKIKMRQLDKSLGFVGEIDFYINQEQFQEDYLSMRYDIQLLSEAFEEMLKNLKRFDHDKLDFFTRIRRERFSLDNKVTELREYFTQSRRISFTDLFTNYRHIEEFITTFLAILEVVKTEHIRIEQSGPFKEIILISEV
jgi:segregation and condensation protein A